ncbi:MAG: DUF2605 domain-containing protein [Phormidesmis sp.]
MAFSTTPPDEPSKNLPNELSEDLPEDLPEDANLMKTILPPLLADFQHWFASTVDMMTTRDVSFLTAEQQQHLLSRVKVAQQQVSVSQVLSAATDNQAGIEMPVVMAWHDLVHECWGVSLRLHQENQKKKEARKGRARRKKVSRAQTDSEVASQAADEMTPDGQTEE